MQFKQSVGGLHCNKVVDLRISQLISWDGAPYARIMREGGLEPFNKLVVLTPHFAAAQEFSRGASDAGQSDYVRYYDLL